MLTPQSLPFCAVKIPPVDKEDVKRLWIKLQELTTNNKASSPAEGLTGSNMRVFEGTLLPQVDPLAVFVRVTLCLSASL